MNEHAPLPWKYNTALCRIFDAANGEVSCVQIYSVAANDNAAFIIKACNAHEELMHFIELVAELPFGCATVQARALLAKLEQS